MIPKPGKTIKRPESLRPLGIQDAAGKAIARVIKEQLLFHIQALLVSFPQFAYLQNLSTQQAIGRVAAHCRGVRTAVSSDRLTVHGKRAGKTRSKFEGGAQLLLDMTAAFDRLPRSALLEALEWAKVPNNLISLILDIHYSCRYHISHEGCESFINMRSGVRQGCTLAPVLWSLFSVFMLSKIEDALECSWPRDHMTLYADDTHCAWRLQSQQDVDFFIRSALVVFDVYTKYGMKINPEKSALIIRLTGTHGARWLKQHTRIVDGRRLFQFRHGLHFVEVPIVKQSKYLGIVVSYHTFETATLQHRLKAAGLARQRLSKVLHSTRHLSLRQGLQIYSTCVRSTMLYGITALGLSDKDLRSLHRKDIRYVRAIAKSPVHITKEKTEVLLTRISLPSIGVVFHKQCTVPASITPATQLTSGSCSARVVLPVSGNWIGTTDRLSHMWHIFSFKTDHAYSSQPKAWSQDTAAS